MPQTQPVRMAIAGMSHGHVYWIMKNWRRADLDLVGISEPDAALADRFAAAFGYPRERIFADLETMLDAVKPEAVGAFGSIFEHLAVVEACAPRGIHVMVEKPLAVSEAHARRMADLARGAGIHLITNYETTWYASTYETRRLVEDGELGPVRKIVVHDGHEGPIEIGCNAEFLAWLTDPVLNGGGAVVDFGCYGANLVTWLMGGAEPTSVTAVLQTLKPDVYPHVDDEATIILTYPHAQGIVQGSWNWPIARKDMEVYGQRGYAVAVDATHMRVRLNDKVDELGYELPPAPAPVSDPFAYFVAVVRGDEIVTPGNLWSLENNLTVVRILDAARRSAREARSVSLSS